jgi:Zn-dependent protease
MGLAQPHNVIHSNLGEQRSSFYAWLDAALYHRGSGGPEWYNPRTMLGLPVSTLISRVFILVIAFTVHEFSHAWTADRFGDDTPRLQGRLTLNPLSHLDPIGSLLLLVAGFGWAKPVPINPYQIERRHPAGTMIVSAAGPLSNLMLAIVAALPFRMGLLQPSSGTGLLPTPSSFLTEFIFINLILLFFNLIPVSPLDGEKVLEYFLPPSGRSTLYQLRPYGPMILLALVFVGPFLGFDLLGTVIGWPTQQVFSALVL